MRAIPVASGTTDVNSLTTSCLLRGWSFREDAGTPAIASLTLRNGASGTAVAEIALGASAGREIFFPSAIRCSAGVTVDRVAGSTVGVLYIDD